MKDYEIYSCFKVPKNLKLVLRLDGRKFHKLAIDLNLKRPYDNYFSKAMIGVARDIFKEFSPLFIYTFSDEFSILLSEIPFSGRIEKLNSIFPSLASSSLTLTLRNEFNKLKQKKEGNENCLDQEINIIGANENSPNQKFQRISFDSRIIPLANEDIPKYFKWRQDESWRNCINSYGYWELRKKLDKNEASEKLKGLKSSDIHELLFKKDFNLNNVPMWQKRGIGIYKKAKKIKGFNPKTKKEEVSYRNSLFVDNELQMFNEDFFKRFLK